MRKPAPRSQNSWIDASRLRAMSESDAVCSDEEIGVRGLVAAADAAAQLVELGEPECVGAVDQDRVRGRDVEAVLDDRGREEHVGLAREEAPHRLLELALRHLAVRDGDARRPGSSSSSRLLDAADRLDPVVHEEDLSAARDLRLDRLADDLVPRRHDLRLDREAVPGRRLDDRQVAEPGEREVQRARDRRGRHGQHVDRGLPLLEPLLLRDAEALLLVDDEETEIAEGEVLREHAVRRDEDVDRAVGGLLRRSSFCSTRERKRDSSSIVTGNAAKRRVNVRKCWSARIVVGARTATCLPSSDRLERGAHRDLGLAVADVAAEEAVHRLGRLHVALDVGDRLGLVRRLDVLERVLELLLPRRVSSRRRTRRRGCAARRASGAGRSCRASPCAPRPCGAPSRRRPDGPARARRPRRRSTSGRGRSARPGSSRLFCSAYSISMNSRSSPSTGTRFRPLKRPDAVVGVDDRVAELQVAQIREERLGRLAPGLRRAALLAEDLLLRVDGQPGLAQPEPGRDLRGHAHDRAAAWSPLGGDVELVLDREALELLGAPRGGTATKTSSPEASACSSSRSPRSTAARSRSRPSPARLAAARRSPSRRARKGSIPSVPPSASAARASRRSSPSSRARRSTSSRGATTRASSWPMR